MKAIRAQAQGGPEQLSYQEAPQPQPGEGEVLVRVYATSITPMELTWSETWSTKAGVKRAYPIPGHEFSGVVTARGSGVTDIQVGEAVYGLTDFSRDGAEAEFTLALPAELAPKPTSLAHVQAAAVPLSGLTAWQALFEHAHLAAGQRVLIHGASGGVGTFAVQFAHWARAQVIGTTSTRNRDFVHQLGADETIDYTTTRFEDVVHDVDVVLDAVGGDVLERSWDVLKPGGMLVSIVKPPAQDQAAARGVRARFFIVQPNRSHLMQISSLIEAGHVRPIIETVLPLTLAREAFEHGLQGHTRGKIVLQVAA